MCSCVCVRAYNVYFSCLERERVPKNYFQGGVVNVSPTLLDGVITGCLHRDTVKLWVDIYESRMEGGEGRGGGL